MKRMIAFVGLCLMLNFVPQANAAVLSFSFSDPLGDNTGAIDLIGMNFSFDDTTGYYTIALNSTSADPFNGDFRINVNLMNLDVGTTAQDPSFFNDVFNEYSLSSATTQMILTGTNARLMSWGIGDEILANNLPSSTPHPDGVTTFRSAVLSFPVGAIGLNEDYIGGNSPTSLITTPVPEPSTLLLLGSGLVGLVGFGRKKIKK